jgi:LmbE family N-acetylglucosaminyl deacetylase
MAGAVLHIGAHPDDEDSGLVAYLSHGLGVRAVYWSATRGEGGQNRRGAERGEALGILRTWESLLAREVDGGEVLFGPFYDYGFSKSGDDALRRWGRDHLILELARAIRIVQPAVVVVRWSGDAADGHGHHQAIGAVAAEAFDVAGEAGRFPEVLDARLPPWPTLKLYRSVGGDWQPGEDGEFGGRVENYERAGYVRVDTGEIDPIDGVSFQEQGHRAINMHRSQGIGLLPEPGPYYYYYRLERGALDAGHLGGGLFAGVDATLTGLLAHFPSVAAPLRTTLETVKEHAARAVESFHPDRPAEAGLAAAEGAAVLHELRNDVGEDQAAALQLYLTRKAREFEDVAAACLGVRVECLLDRARTTPGRPVRVRARVWAPARDAVDVAELRLETPRGWRLDRARPEDDAHLTGQGEWEICPPDEAPTTVPYWLREPRRPYRYTWPLEGPAADPLDPAAVTATAEVEVDSRRLSVRVPALHRSAFPGGFRELSLSILPRMTVRPRKRRELVPLPVEPIVLELVAGVRCIQDRGGDGVLTIRAPDGWDVYPDSIELSFARGGEGRTVAFEVTIPAGTGAGRYDLVYDLQCDGRNSAFDLETTRLVAEGATEPVDEDNCTAESHQISAACVEVCLIDAEFVRTLRYGYVEGAQESILESILRFGLDVALLSDDELAYGKLDGFDAIVVGPNAYNTRHALQQNAARLLEYVAEGGTLVVQYQGYGYAHGAFAPYPFTFNQPHDRVTDPDADVRFLNSGDPLLHLPNELTPADFDHWVHDRGLYFFGEWDTRYRPLFATADRGDVPREGGLLTASYGRGGYAYVGFSLHRQIPAGVQGAVRLFANLLGLAEARVRARKELLGRVRLFDSLSDDDLYEGARVMSERWIPAGTELVRQGDRGNEMFILYDGRMVAVRATGDEERVVEVLNPGDSLGEVAVLAGTPRAATVRAETDSRVLVLPADALKGWLRRDPDLAMRVMERLARLVVHDAPDG